MINIDTGMCIGGPADGERRKCLGSVMEVPIYSQLSGTSSVERYMREVFECNKTVFHYWRHSSFTVEETIERLFRVYGEQR